MNHCKWVVSSLLATHLDSLNPKPNHLSDSLYTNQQQVLSFTEPFACLGSLRENVQPKAIVLSQNLLSRGHYQCFYFFPPISWFVNFVKIFHFFEHIFLEFTLFKTNFSISSIFCSHSAKIHQEKSLLYTEFLLFFHSGFTCYDLPCHFSFFPQAAQS
jgi:hypothetical protein